MIIDDTAMYELDRMIEYNHANKDPKYWEMRELADDCIVKFCMKNENYEGGVYGLLQIFKWEVIKMKEKLDNACLKEIGSGGI